MKTIDERQMQKTTKEKQTKTERSKGNRNYGEMVRVTQLTTANASKFIY